MPGVLRQLYEQTDNIFYRMMLKTSTHFWGRHYHADVYLFRIENDKGAYVELTNYGAGIVSVVVPNRDGVPENVVVGFPNLDGYLSDTCYIGSTIGRYANRISGAKFELNGSTFYLDANDGKNSNHAGKSGFNYRVFDAEFVDNKLKMNVKSRDGDGGYPGNLELTVTYSWSNDNELLINYSATTDQDTIANFTSHAYFNLSAFHSPVFEQKLTINSQKIIENHENYIPTGAIITDNSKIFNGDKLIEKFQKDGDGKKGINLFYILNETENKQELNHAATLADEGSGRTLTVYTNYPGVFLYTGDYLTSTNSTHTGQPAKPFDGLCLECQHYPDSINQPNFPQAILRGGKVYDQNIMYQFGLISK